MDAIIRIFKRVNGLPENDGDKATGAAFCSIRLLVASTQAISLIGKQGSLIKSIQETTGASVRVLSNGTITSFNLIDSIIFLCYYLSKHCFGKWLSPSLLHLGLMNSESEHIFILSEEICVSFYFYFSN